MYAPYSDAIDWLNAEDPFFTRVVLDLGAPKIIRREEGDPEVTPRESVQLVTERKHGSEDLKIQMLIHAEAFESQTAPQQAFLLSKMALHAMLQHIGERDSDQFPDKALLADIHEAIVTDLLLDLFYTPTEDCITGSERFGTPLPGLSTEQAYQMLADEFEDTDNTEYTGPFASLPEPALLQSVLNGFLNDSVSGLEVPEVLVDSLGATEEMTSVTADPAKGCSQGINSQSEVELMAKANPGKVEWVELLLEVNPDLGKKPGYAPLPTRKDWTRRPARLMHMSSDLVLPSYVPVRDPARAGFSGGAKPKMVLALDLSGSIPSSAAQLMAELARMAPAEKIEVVCCTFSHFALPFDHTSDNNEVAYGGTDFSVVERFVRSTMKPGESYPTVVCITDGESSFPDESPTAEQLETKWHWLPVSNGDRRWMERNPQGYGYGSHHKKIFHQILSFSLM